MIPANAGRLINILPITAVQQSAVRDHIDALISMGLLVKETARA
jgi:predicted ArsR family transcriptional regulator